MTDRELLELAAKAAGIEINEKMQNERDETGYGHVGLFTKGKTCWNPLTDDGDALRLAVKLEMETYHNTYDVPEGEVYASYPTISGVIAYKVEQYNGDQLAATRRAIVRAAAEIGKVMP